MTKQKASSHEPKYISGSQAGYSDAAKRYLSKSGKYSTRNKCIEENAVTSKESFGGKVKFQFPTPITRNFEILEANMSSLNDSSAPFQGFANILKATLGHAESYQNAMQASYKSASDKYDAMPQDRKNQLWAVRGFDKAPETKPMANYMPMQIQTRMNLAEHFWQTDGDAMNVCEAPIEILARDVDVICPDKSLRNDIKDWIQEIGLSQIMAELWSVMREYGQAYPFEVWSEDGKNAQIVMLPPKSVHIGYNWAYGLSSMMVGESEWTKTLLEAVFPPAMFRILMRHWDDSPIATPGQGAFLPGDNLRPVFDKGRDWSRYSMPMISRGFRELVSRQVYEDSVRALVEGIRYQLWVIKVGDADHPPMPQEISAVRDMLNGISGEPTGMFVWRDSPLSVEVHIPKGLDQMIGNDYGGILTKNFFRKMGISSEIISGEMPGQLGASGGKGGGGGSKSDIDVQLYIERARYQAGQVTSWAEYLVRKWARANSKRVKDLNKIRLPFMPTVIEMENRIKNIFGPMYKDGAISQRTYVGNAGLDGDNEIAQKRIEKKDQDVLMPPATFSQVVVNDSGEVKKTATQTEPEGSPTEDQEATNKIKRSSHVIDKDEEPQS